MHRAGLLVTVKASLASEAEWLHVMAFSLWAESALVLQTVWGRGAPLLFGPAATLAEGVTGKVSFIKISPMPCPLNYALSHEPWGDACLLVGPYASCSGEPHLSTVGGGGKVSTAGSCSGPPPDTKQLLSVWTRARRKERQGAGRPPALGLGS